MSFSFTATAALAVALLWAHPAVAQFNGQFVERNLVDHPVCVASSSSAFISAADAVDDERYVSARGAHLVAMVP